MDGETEKCYIRKIVYFKQIKSPFHEFLLIEIVHPYSEQISLAITERTPHKTDDYNTKRAVSPSISRSVVAKDTVRLVFVEPDVEPDVAKLSSCNKPRGVRIFF